MLEYGKFLRAERKYRGLRQADIADGICSVDTISRIENGSQIPTATIFSMCMERLGVSGFSYGDFFDSASVRMYELRQTIRLCFDFEDMEGAVDALGEYKEALGHGNIWDRQFFEFARVRYLHSVGETNARCLDEYKKAALMSLTDLEGRRDFVGRALTATEISILAEIGILQYGTGFKIDAVMLYNRMLIHVRRYSKTGGPAGDCFGKILSNTAMCEYSIYRDEAKRHIDQALNIAARHCNINSVFRMLFNRNQIIGCDDLNLPGGPLHRNYNHYTSWMDCGKSYEEFRGDDVFLHLM